MASHRSVHTGAPLADAKAIAITLATLDLRSAATDGRAQRRASFSSATAADACASSECTNAPTSFTGLCASPASPSSLVAGSTTAAPRSSRQRHSPTTTGTASRRRRSVSSAAPDAHSTAAHAAVTGAGTVVAEAASTSDPAAPNPAVAALLAAFTDYASAVQTSAPSQAAALPHYAVSLGAGPVGMVLRLVAGDGNGGGESGAGDSAEAACGTVDGSGCGCSIGSPPAPPRVLVDELRADPATGAPLLALGSGRISLGDELLAVNGRLLALAPSPLDAVAAEFCAARRPVTLLLRRRRGAGVIGGDGSGDRGGCGAAAQSGAGGALVE